MRASTDACTLISQATLKSILGLGNIGEVRDIPGHHYPEESDGMVEDTCFGLAWSGAKPTNQKQGEEKVANGTAAEWGWTTFAPDTGAPPEDLARWVGPTTVNGKPDIGQYPHHVANLEGGGLKELIAAITHLHNIHGGVYSTPSLGARSSVRPLADCVERRCTDGCARGGSFGTGDSSVAVNAHVASRTPLQGCKFAPFRS
jgi:hypothetical protein